MKKNEEKKGGKLGIRAVAMAKKSAAKLKKEGLGFAKLGDEDEYERMLDNREIINKPRKHEIYDNTMYIPHTKTRIIESQITASLTLQILLYFNFYYSIMYSLILFSCTSYKRWIFDFNLIFMEQLGAVFWIVIEFIRLYYGYKGNINENFPELIAFLIFSLFFQTPLIVYQVYSTFRFPIEKAAYIIIVIFTVAEVFFGVLAIYKIVKIQTAQFFLRNAPTLDEDYMKSMNYRKRQMMTSKEVELTRKGYRPHEFYEIPKAQHSFYNTRESFFGKGSPTKLPERGRDLTSDYSQKKDHS